MSVPLSRRSTPALTAKQEAVLGLWPKLGEDPVEGDIVNYLYPLIPDGRSARMTCNHMVKRGLITFGSWWDEAGYELHLTDAGRAALEAQDAA